MERSSEQRGRRLAFDLGPIAELVLDASGILRLSNERARELLGVRHEDAGEPFLSLECSHRPVELHPMIEQARLSGRGETIRGVRTTTPDGRTLILDVQVIGLIDDGGPFGTIVTFTDVTTLHRMLGEIRRTERRTRVALDELRLARAQLERLSEDLRSSDMDLKLTSEELRSSTEELEITSAELRAGTEELAKTSEDLQQRITDLGLAERLMDSVVDTLGAAFVLDTGSKVQLWSNECEDLWGLHHGDVRGRSLRDIQFGLPVRPIEALVRSVLEGGERTEAVVDATDREGVPFPCRVVASPLGPLSADGDGVLVLVRREPVVG